MSKKWIVVLVIIGALVSYGVYDFCMAKYHISKYIEKQGIEKEDILVDDFKKDFKLGGYWYHASIKGERPDMYYKYAYRNGEVFFSAYQLPEEAVKKKWWGGNGLDFEEEKKLKYPPLEQK